MGTGRGTKRDVEEDGRIDSDCASRIATYKYCTRKGEGRGQDERLIDEWISDISIEKFWKDRNAYLIGGRHKSTACSNSSGMYAINICAFK